MASRPSKSTPSIALSMEPAPDSRDAAESDPWKCVAVVSVTHQSPVVIATCLESVRRAAQIIVVDNASDDGACLRPGRVLAGFRCPR